MPLVAQHISKAFGNEQVLDDLNLQLDEHETLSILGRSGSGKTTLLKILAGLTAPDEGRVLVNDQEVLSLAAHEREIVYLYQEALLFPHLNIFENLAFGLRLRKIDRAEVNNRVDEMIQHLELDGMRDKMPHQLSGGQKQRISFGRALITNPRVLLLDEPFGNLDADTRGSMQQLFKNIAKEFEITSVFVTHNVKEAILMGDRIAKLKNGQLRIYPTLESFLETGDNMVQEEIDFWQSVSNTKQRNN